MSGFEAGWQAPRFGRSGRRAWRSPGRIVLSVFLVLTGVLFLLPVLWVVLQSFEVPKDQISVAPVWTPTQVTLGSYRALFATPFLLNLVNSVGVTLAVVLGAAVVSVLAAYAFARIEFRGRELIFTLFLAALTLPSQVSAVPEFVVIKYLHLLDNQASLVIPALIQVIPMSWPAISAVMIITGQYIWNDFFWPNLFITSTNRMTAPLALYNLESVTGGGPVGAVFAGLSVLCVPCVIAFVFLQRRLMEGIGFRGIAR